MATQTAAQMRRLTAVALGVLREVKGAYAPRLEQCDPFKSVGYFKKCILEFDEAQTIAGLEIVTNVPRECIQRIWFEYTDGSEFSGFYPEFLVASDAYDGKWSEEAVVAAEEISGQTRIFIDFAKEEHRTTDGIRRGELVVLPGEKIRMVVLTAGKGEFYPETLEMYANKRVLPAQPDRYFVPRIWHGEISQTVAGEQTHNFPLKGANHRIWRMWLKTSNLQSFEILRDRKKVTWGYIDDIKSNLRRQSGKQMPDGWVVIDFVNHGFATEGAFVPVCLESLQIKLRTAAAEEIPVYFEYVTQNKEIPTGE
ncbi:hypothetical protein [Vibrio hannami]|uniref:hypothetical protein n=1 Tax=Vibrio hannami TaxID=2717094 RepID=UPI003EB6E0D4